MEAPTTPPGDLRTVTGHRGGRDDTRGVGRRGRAATPSGRLLLVEGRWSTGGGLAAAEVARLVGTVRQEADVVQLTDPALWGGPVDDERFLVLSRR